MYSLTGLLRVISPKLGFALHTEKWAWTLSQEEMLVLGKSEP